MNLLWTYVDLLNKIENEVIVLEILTNVLENDIISHQILDSHLKEIEILKIVEENKIFDEVFEIVVARKKNLLL